MDMSYKILIVEDDESLHNALKDKFAKEGFIVFQAHDGEQGLKMALEQHPDLILLDILMPKMDGLTMLKKFREVDKDKKTPVMLLSNLTDVKEISEALLLGAKEYFVKSNWKLEDLVAKVNDKLNK
jgi:DNA-binding response OmpR family regulator